MMSKVLLSLVVLAVAAITAESAITAVVGGYNTLTVTSNTCNAASCFFARLVGSGNANYTTVVPTVVANVATYNGVPTASYEVADTGSTAWTVVNTTCFLPDQPVNAIDFANSGTAVAGSQNRLRLTLRFWRPVRYTSFSYRYNGAGAVNCNSSVNSVVETTFQTWTTGTTGNADCTTRNFMTYVHDFNHALANCGYVRDESAADNTTFTANIIITTTDQGTFLRNVQYIRTLETGVTVRLAFRTNINATVSNTIFGQRVTMFQLVGQFWDTVNLRATLRLYTSVQWPYRLTNPVIGANSFNASHWQTPTIGIINAPCLNNASNAQAAGEICGQFWNVTIRRQATCTGNVALTLAGTWTLNFSVECSPLYTGSNCTSVGSTDAITFTTDSTNYCPQLVGTSASTAILQSFSDAARTLPNTQFVFGTTSFFVATVTSPIRMDRAYAEFIYLTSGGTLAPTNPIYFRPFNGSFTAATYWTGSTGVFNTFGGTPFNDATTTNMQVTDGISAGNFTQRILFQIRWNSLVSNATGDAPRSTVVQINIRVRYTNQSTTGKEDELIVAQFKANPMEANLVSATSNVYITAEGVNTGGEVASTSSGVSMSVIGVVAGAVGGMAVISAFAVVLLRRRNAAKKEEGHMDAIQLASA